MEKNRRDRRCLKEIKLLPSFASGCCDGGHDDLKVPHLRFFSQGIVILLKFESKMRTVSRSVANLDMTILIIKKLAHFKACYVCYCEVLISTMQT